jgi:hypothetical protein
MPRSSREIWEDYHNIHEGETCLVIGNGTSLANESNDFLRSFPSFGTNRIYLKKDFTPNYYVCINEFVARQYKEEIEQVKATKFVTDKVSIDGAIPLHSNYIMAFSKEPYKSISEGNTVTYVCLQIAYWMGFSTVLLVGVDHRYKFDGEPHGVLLATGADPNHFDPSYFSDGKLWNAPDLDGSEAAYKIARRVFESDHRKIINITPGSSLEVFEKDEEYGE